jgi:hypothetical protein
VELLSSEAVSYLGIPFAGPVINFPNGLSNADNETPGVRGDEYGGGVVDGPVPANVDYFYNRWQTNSVFPLDFGTDGTISSLAEHSDQGVQNTTTDPYPVFNAQDPLDLLGLFTGDVEVNPAGVINVLGVQIPVNTDFLESTAQLHWNFPQNPTIDSELESIVGLIASDAAPSVSTTTVVASSANESVLGQDVTFSATVTGTGGTPTGTVTFMDGSTPLGTTSLIDGVATFSTSELTARDHSITAVYSGDTTFAPSVSPILAQVVNAAGTYVEISDDGYTVVVTPTTITEDGNDSTYAGSQQFTIDTGFGTDTFTIQSTATNVTVTFDVDGPRYGISVIASGNSTVNSVGNWTNYDGFTVSAIGDGVVDLQGTISNSNSTIYLAGGGAINLQGVIQGGTLASVDGTRLIAGGEMEGMSVDGDDLDLSNGALSIGDGLTLTGTLTLGGGNNAGYLYFSGTQTLSGTGTIDFASVGAVSELIPFEGTLTVGAGITIEGQNGELGGPFNGSGLVLQGPVIADGTGSSIVISVSGATWSTSGTLAATNGGTLYLQSTWINSGSAVVSASGGGVVNLQCSMGNAGGTLMLAGGGAINFVSGTIQGGTVASTDGTPLVVASGTLESVTMNADLDLTANGSGLSVSNGLTLNGTATLGGVNAQGSLYFSSYGAQTLAGTGTIVLAGDGYNSGGVLHFPRRS